MSVAFTEHIATLAPLQFGTVVAYLFAAGSLGGHRAMMFALLWNVWSIVDAARHEKLDLQSVDSVGE